jgi:hypothetical protein
MCTKKAVMKTLIHNCLIIKWELGDSNPRPSRLYRDALNPACPGALANMRLEIKFFYQLTLQYIFGFSSFLY